MLTSIVIGFVGVLIVGFLLFCHAGFSRAKQKARDREITSRVFPLGCLRSPKRRGRQQLLFFGLLLAPSVAIYAQETSAPSSQSVAPAPVLLAVPSMAGPLSIASHTTLKAGPFGNVSINGIFSGFGSWQDDPVASDTVSTEDISNAQIFLQKTDGIVQYFIQAGAYNIAALGVPFISTGQTVNNLFGALPVAYVDLVPSARFSVEAGKLTTLMGNENTFSFQNMNIERGLLWNQTNDISRGIQVNYKTDHLSGSFSYNDGYYSNRYNWLTGAATYTIGAHDSLIMTGGGNLGRTGYATAATPLYQNNSRLYDLIYTRNTKRWTISPYFQFNYVPKKPSIGVLRTTWTHGLAVLASYSISPRMFIVGRAEFINSTGTTTDGAVNLIYGPGSQAWSITLTPTYQKHIFFARPEFSFVRALHATPGDAFGRQGDDTEQVRGMIEAGFMF